MFFKGLHFFKVTLRNLDIIRRSFSLKSLCTWITEGAKIVTASQISWRRKFDDHSSIRCRGSSRSNWSSEISILTSLSYQPSCLVKFFFVFELLIILIALFKPVSTLVDKVCLFEVLKKEYDNVICRKFSKELFQKNLSS